MSAYLGILFCFLKSANIFLWKKKKMTADRRTSGNQTKLVSSQAQKLSDLKRSYRLLEFLWAQLVPNSGSTDSRGKAEI